MEFLYRVEYSQNIINLDNLLCDEILLKRQKRKVENIQVNLECVEVIIW